MRTTARRTGPSGIDHGAAPRCQSGSAHRRRGCDRAAVHTSPEASQETQEVSIYEYKPACDAQGSEVACIMAAFCIMSFLHWRQILRRHNAGFRYFLLATFAVTASVTVPMGSGTTTFDNLRSEEYKTIFFYGLTVILFSSLYMSDPGYLGTIEMSDSESNNVDDTRPSANNASLPTESVNIELGTKSQTPADDERVRLTASTLNNDVAFDSFLRDRLNDVQSSEEAVVDSLQPTDSERLQGQCSCRRKHCDICRVYPPLRAHHCRDCRRCVATFDHHCHFIGTCIGELNHARFLCFCLCQSIGFWHCCRLLSLSQYGLWPLMTYSTGDQPILWLATCLYLVLIKTVIYGLAFASFLVLGIHLFMALSNSTTFEFAKASHLEYMRGLDAMALPFSQGSMCANLRVFITRDAAFANCCRGRTMAVTPWAPIEWPVPNVEERESEEWWNNPWRNKYWSCC